MRSSTSQSTRRRASTRTQSLLALLLPPLVVGCMVAGCMGAGAMRSTTVAGGSGRGTRAREARSSSAAYGSWGSGEGGGGGGSTGVEFESLDVATDTGSGDAPYADSLSSSPGAYIVAAEPAGGSFAGSYGGDADMDDYRGEESALYPPGPASSPPADVTVARLLEDGGPARAPHADASSVLGSAGAVGEAVAETASDATADGGPLLIYTAGIWLAVYEVRESQATIVARAEELGGFVQHQTDTELTLRVPAAQFDALVEAATAVGDLLHREIAADDVSEEYRDVEIRIRNLEAMRVRLEVLLTQATAVEDALRVERELERVTVELERLRGRQRFLSDRIALATITIHFEARPRDRIDQPEIFALPFYWLQNLGLPNLLSLH